MNVKRKKRKKAALLSAVRSFCYAQYPYWKEALRHATPYTPREAFGRGIVDDLIEEGGDIMAAAKP